MDRETMSKLNQKGTDIIQKLGINGMEDMLYGSDVLSHKS
jgi:hypothetical protein